jgi:outer membrane protein insertion porin family
MRLNKHFLLLFFLFAPLLLHSQQYELMRVAKLDIIPENLSPEMAFNPNSVRTRMHTKVGNFFSQIEFDNDLKMLADEYDRVEPCLEVINNEIHITLRVWFKPVIHAINFCGNERINTKKLMKTLEIECGALFERAEFIKAINKLRLLYVKKGYFEADIDYEVIPLEEGNQIDIQITVCEGRAGRIKKITFKGISSAEEDELLEMILTKRYNLFLSWYTGRGVYHPDMIDHDRLQIINFFQNHGYADAMVELSVEEAPESDRIILVISVEKGQRYTIGNLSLCGNTLFPNEKIWEQFTFGRGSVYSPEEIRSTIQAITDLYGACGYIDTNIDFQVSLREDCPIYDIVVSIEEGEQYYVGLIKVFGNCYTQTRLILHESLLCPGEVFDNRKLEGTEGRLANTGYFSAVNVYAVRSQIEDPSGERNYRDVFIEVEETDTGNLGIFFGFSSLDRIFGGVEVTERNFNIAGLAHLLERGVTGLRGGGEFVNAKVNIGDRQTSYLLQWSKPYFLDTPWILGVDLEKSNNRVLSRAYDIKTYGGSVHGSYIMNTYLKYDIHYRARHTHVSINDEKNPLLVKEGNKSGFISAVGATLMYDSTDHPRRATSGLRSRLMYEIAGVGGNFQFMRFAYLNTYYFPVSARGTLKWRGEIQFIKTYGSTKSVDLPLSERLFLGGETTVRGYRPFIIGPKFGNNEPRGGLSSYLLSEEYQHNLLKVPCLDGFVFVDAGYVSFSEFTVGTPAASVGFGIRIEVMRNMPLMIGLGWPIHPFEKRNGVKIDTAQRFFFAMGGCF